ncbi:MAG TPA: hypothetical protein VN688_00495 [Gemmataceae bacterium]|nr:hypothetical protein [Gemmataceae bacterium]
MELKPIERTDRATMRLNAALNIYRETILPEAQNPERQILYWIEHSREALSDEFRCFAIQRGGEVIGYLQYSYFCEEHVFFFEYLCIRDKERRGLVPSDAVQAIEDFLAEGYRPDFSIVFEVARVRATAGDWRRDTKVVNYFRRLGFREVDFEYRYPILQSYDGQTSYPADLMVRLPGKRTQVAAPEMRTILRCLYFKHYLRWDRPFLPADRFAERERLINELYSTQVAAIGDNDSFGTHGDDKRSQVDHFTRRQPRLRIALEEIFGPKLVRICALAAVLVAAARLLGNALLFVPFVLAVAALYCLMEDTASSRKLFVLIMSRMKVVKQRPS